ncbi:MAG: ATP-binding protein [Syntrophus sp. (in: bacteria)]|nr:ATP-binding protein [Syntrophus sp. (in: bacteria)]
MPVPLKIKLPARMDSLHVFMEQATVCAEKQGFSTGRIKDIGLALEELLVNIINYAYPGGEGHIEVTCRPDACARLVFEIADSGIPFNMLAFSDPDTTAEIGERRIGGLGIFFVKQLMDEVHYRREDNRNILTITVSGSRKED